MILDTGDRLDCRWSHYPFTLLPPDPLTHLLPSDSMQFRVWVVTFTRYWLLGSPDSSPLGAGCKDSLQLIPAQTLPCHQPCQAPINSLLSSCPMAPCCGVCCGGTGHQPNCNSQVPPSPILEQLQALFEAEPPVLSRYSLSLREHHALGFQGPGPEAASTWKLQPC